MTLSHQSNYRAEIDGLRAFAVLSVVAFHAFPYQVAGGFIGVDVFFVISGFLITSHIFESFDNGHFSFSSFFARRIRRLFPALILVMVSSLTFGWFALLPDELEQLGKHVASGAAFVLNFVLVGESGYFDNASETKPMLHLWSLAIEEQFYIVWPLMLWLAWMCRLNLFVVTVVIAVFSFCLNLSFVDSKPVEAFFLPVGRFWELLSGSALAWLQHYKHEKLTLIRHWSDRIIARIFSFERPAIDSSWSLNVMSFVGLVMLVFSVILMNEGVAYPSAWALVPVMGSVFVIGAGRKSWASRLLLMNPIAVWFGLISYPLYLWHWPILSYLHIIDGEIAHRDARILAVAFSIVLAWLTYRLVENHFRTKTYIKFKTATAVFLLMVVGLAGYKISKGGLENREWVVNQSLINRDLPDVYRNMDGWICSDLTKISGRKGRCAFSRDFPKTVMIGDSHVPALYVGLKGLYEELGRGIGVLGGGGGCPPLYDVVSKDGDVDDVWNCIEKITDTIDLIANSSDIEDVILLSRGPLYTTGKGFGGIKEDPYSEWLLYIRGEEPYLRRNIDVFEIGLRNTLDVLIRSNKKVIFVFDVPELGFHAKACISERYYFPKKHVRSNCSINRDIFDQRVLVHRGMVQSVLDDYPEVDVIDQSEALCDDSYCFGGIHGRLYYRDDDHLSLYGATYVVDRLKDQFRVLYR